MRAATIAVAFALIAAGCNGPSTSPTEPATFTLKPGQTAAAQGVIVTFRHVLSDSRCPINALCVWAGEATVEFIVRGLGKAAKYELELGIDPARRTVTHAPAASGWRPADGSRELSSHDRNPRPFMNIDRHKPGAFCWFELATTDQRAAKEFYQALFGWESSDSPIGPDEIYTIFKMHGRDVGAAYTMRADQQAQGVPPNWGIYIAVDSADTAAERAQALGATILAPPFDVGDHGRMCVMQDPTGAVFSIWQPNKRA
jgi:predicted enzyme related to lactoylglutathione lyase